MLKCKTTLSKLLMLIYLQAHRISASIAVAYKNVVTKHCITFEDQSAKRRTVTFCGTLQELAAAVAVGQSASGGIPRCIRMAIVHTADHETLCGGIARCFHRLQGRARDREAVP